MKEPSTGRFITEYLVFRQTASGLRYMVHQLRRYACGSTG
jgi:hypothetical protein